MGFVVALALLAGRTPPRAIDHDPWLGADKIKHFLLSAMLESMGTSAARAGGMKRGPALGVGTALTFTVGVGREAHDVRIGKGFSVKDLTWDVAGGVAAASLLNGSR
jgi:putative lipoprotein